MDKVLYTGGVLSSGVSIGSRMARIDQASSCHTLAASRSHNRTPNATSSTASVTASAARCARRSCPRCVIASRPSVDPHPTGEARPVSTAPRRAGLDRREMHATPNAGRGDVVLPRLEPLHVQVPDLRIIVTSCGVPVSTSISLRSPLISGVTSSGESTWITATSCPGPGARAALLETPPATSGR